MNRNYPGPGSVLAERFRVVRQLGEGGMGVVFEALNTLTEKRVAIKWLRFSAHGNPNACERMMREAAAACRVRHPNVVDVYDAVQHGDDVFLVMELLEGESLRALLDRGGMALHELIALLLAAMRGVAEAHRQGVIHRDIHPGNIFLARRAGETRLTPVVLDFGVSKVDHEGGEKRLTRSGMTMGTPLYTSYEQMCATRDVDARTDVYSFGVILYEAVTGYVPYEGESFAEVAIKLATSTPIPPRQLRPALPVALERVIMRAIARQRDERIDSLDTLVRQLELFTSPSAFLTQPEDEADDAAAEASEATDPALDAQPAPSIDVDGNLRAQLATTRPTPPPPTPLPARAARRRRALLAGMSVGVALTGGLVWWTLADAAVSAAVDGSDDGVLSRSGVGSALPLDDPEIAACAMPPEHATLAGTAPALVLPAHPLFGLRDPAPLDDPALRAAAPAPAAVPVAEPAPSTLPVAEPAPSALPVAEPPEARPALAPAPRPALAAPVRAVVPARPLPTPAAPTYAPPPGPADPSFVPPRAPLEPIRAGHLRKDQF